MNFEALVCTLKPKVELKFSSWLKHSNKRCDWLKLACFIRVQMHANATSVRLEIKVCFENNANAWGN